ncbi:MAG: PIG-L family deacetylase [Candidatus Hydrogenedentes bacterium]|nr:PIG-L family deacetylase [Candidatus Hydrogenedentota bacterium]
MKTLTIALAVLGSVIGAQTAFAAEAAASPEIPAADRIENWTGKTVMVFTPHPDDDTFLCGGVMALLAANKNNVIVVIYTNDNKGSLDLEMTRERLAVIRRAEEEAACAVLGIPKENIVWLGYEDGDLEYADPKVLRGEACRLIKKYRPDAIFTIDPGTTYERWHKTDHRMAAFITKDAFIASEWHLYYPQHLLDEGLKPYRVPVAFYYYTEEPNYTVDITAIVEKKIEASAKHVSQFEPSLSKYTPEMSKDTFAGIRLWGMAQMKEGDKYVEKFRREVEP